MTAVGRFLSRLSRAFRPGAGRRTGRQVRASYDAAQTTTENAEHWAWTDALNANASNDPATRQVLRERSRYECANNGYAGGLVRKLGNDLIGRCPRVQVSIPGADRKVARRVEKAFARWARKVRLGRKLRLLDNAAVRDGEGFAVLFTNPRLPAAGVQLDLRLYETDQVDTPFLDWTDRLAFPGGRIDEFGNVTEWHFLKAHPGSNVWVANFLEYDAVPAAAVIHWFSPGRAGQLRGVPEILSSLTLYAYLRRYTLATLVAAETAANIAGVLETDAPADTGDGPSFDTMDDVPIPRGGLLTLPGGWKANAFKAEQPTTAHGDFKNHILTEAGQPVGAPQNVSTGSSAAYNYSSGRLDHGIYQRGVGVRREDVAEPALDQVFAAWLDEAAVVPGLIPDGLPPYSEWTWTWQFDGFSSIDPQKEAAANKTRLENGETNLAIICAEQGEDWEEVMEQRQREFDRQKELRQATRPGADPTAPPGSAPGGSAAPAGLSDSQVSTVLKILDAVAAKKLDPAAAVVLIRTAFPAITENQAAAFVGSPEVAHAAA